MRLCIFREGVLHLCMWLEEKHVACMVAHGQIGGDRLWPIMKKGNILMVSTWKVTHES